MPSSSVALVALCAVLQVTHVTSDCSGVPDITTCSPSGESTLLDCFVSASPGLPAFCNANEDRLACCDRKAAEIGHGYSCTSDGYELSANCLEAAHVGHVVGLVFGIVAALALLVWFIEGL